MLRRIDAGKVSGLVDCEKCYIDKFALFNADTYSFRNFNDYVLYTDILLSIVTKTTIVGEIKDYMVKMLSALSSLKDLYLKDFSKYEPHYNTEAYVAKIKQVKENFYTEVVIEKPLLETFELSEITMEQYNCFTKNESFQERQERTQKGEQKPEPDKISYAVDGERISITFPKDLSKQYDRHLCGIIENKTGDFYTDLFSELCAQFSSVKASLTCNTYTAKSITDAYVNVEVANAFNCLVQALSYLRNSSSFRSSELFAFDLYEVDSKMNMASLFLDKAIDFELFCKGGLDNVNGKA